MWATLESASASDISTSKSWRSEAPAPPSSSGMRRLPSPAPLISSIWAKGASRSRSRSAAPSAICSSRRSSAGEPGRGCSRSAVVAIVGRTLISINLIEKDGKDDYPIGDRRGRGRVRRCRVRGGAQPANDWLPTTESSWSRSALSLPGAAVKTTRRSVWFSAVST